MARYCLTLILFLAFSHLCEAVGPAHTLDYPELFRAGEGYGDFISSRGVTECRKTECQCQDHLDKATRLWNSGLLLADVDSNGRDSRTPLSRAAEKGHKAVFGGPSNFCCRFPPPPYVTLPSRSTVHSC